MRDRAATEGDDDELVEGSDEHTQVRDLQSEGVVSLPRRYADLRIRNA